MIDWIIENKSWFLSGLGIFIVSLIIPLFRWLFLRKPQESLSKIQDSGRDSYIAGQNIFIANRNEVAHPSVMVRMLFILAIVALLLSSVVFNMPLPLKNIITPEAKIPIIKKKLTLHDAYMTDFSDYPNNQRIMSDAIYTTSYSDGTDYKVNIEYSVFINLETNLKFIALYLHSHHILMILLRV